MSRDDLLALSPLIVLACTAVAAMLGIAVRRSHRLSAWMTFGGLLAAMASLALAWPLAGRSVTPLLVVDQQGLYFAALILTSALAVTAISYPCLASRSRQPEEYYVLLTLATLGGVTLAVGGHFASVLLGVELLSVSLYALVAYQRSAEPALEAGIKYLVVAGFSSAFLLMGMALAYADSGTLQLSASAGAEGAGVLWLAGLALVLVGLGFKLALVPMHMWTPDVYQGAPIPVAAFIATVSKGSVLALLLRFYMLLAPADRELVGALLAGLAAASMVVGNLLALRQNSLKRLLGYSSVAHMGYALVALVAGGARGAEAVAFYLAAYVVTMLGVFASLAAQEDADTLGGLKGLAWRRPWLASVLTAMLLSLAGIPLTAGFIGKFYVLSVGAAASSWTMVSVMTVSSVIGLYYYLRVIAVLFARSAPDAIGPADSSRPVAPTTRAVLVALTVLLAWLGLWPSSLIRLAQAVMGHMA